MSSVPPAARAAGRPVPAPRGLAHARTLALAGEDLHAAVAELHAAYGPAFAFGFGPIRFAWFVGADAARTILHERRDAFSQRGGYDFLKVVGGPTALISSDEPEHLRRRRRVQPAFHGRHVASWLATCEAVLGPWLASLADAGDPVDLYRGLRPRLVRIVARIALGDVPLARDEAWLRDVNALMDFPGRPMLEQQWKLPIPGTPWARFVAARRRVDRALYAEIARRRATVDPATPSGDVLGMLLAPGEEGAAELGDAELRDQTLSLISAGFDTTAAALTWCLAMAAEHPEAGGRLREALAHGDPVAAQREPYVDAFVKETLRLRPPAAAALRRTTAEVEVAGFRLPPRQRVAFSILWTHRDPAAFPEPDRFDPARFSNGDPPPFTYLPFGHGARHCIGAGTATALVKAGLALALGRYETVPARPGPYVPAGMTLHPDGGFPATVTRHASR